MLELKTTALPDADILKSAAEAFEDYVIKRSVRLHGYLLLRGDCIAAEKYWKPYGVNTNHRMYSVTKSFVALAVGLLIRQGRIHLDDRICTYFPEKLPKEGAHPWCEQMTIAQMLSMRTCHSQTTYSRYDGDWTESFFRVNPDHIPGTVFHYDTSSPHVLAALTEKLTGKAMLDYLREGVLNELGFSENAYIIKDPYGVSQGGSGLMCTLRDVAAATWLCSHEGILEGRELLPVRYMRQAMKCQTPTDLQPSQDEQNGYGYFFWRPRVEGGVMYGLGGQLALCFPQLDACFLTMADTIGCPAGLQILYDGFYEHLYPVLTQIQGVYSVPEEACGADPEQEECQKPEDLEGRYVCYENNIGWKWLELDFAGGRLRYETPDGVGELYFGEDVYEAQKFPGTPYACECIGTWKMGHFVLKCYITDEEQGHVFMDFAWNCGQIGMRMASTGEPFFKNYRGTLSAYRI